MKAKVIILQLIAFITLSVNAADRITITIQNPMSARRVVAEMAEVDADAVAAKLFGKGSRLTGRQLLVCSEKGDTMDYQVTYDGKLIFRSPVTEGKGKCRVYVSALTGKATKTAAKVAGRLYPERQSDFSFENDRIAYRIYGPDTQRKGERLYGYDIFNKRTDKLVLDKWYDLQCDKQMWNTVSKLRKMGQRSVADDVYNYGFCYHVDHGEGMDCYKVGSTLGAGTNALMAGSDIIYPWCFKDAEILDNGPLRITVRLTFAPVKVNGTEISETRILTLDAGSSMVKAKVVYEGKPDAKNIAGVAVHKENAKAYIINKERGYVAYEDLGDPDIYQKRYREKQDPEKGKCFVACLLPGASDCRYQPLAKEVSGSLGHLLVVGDSKNEMVYYFGNAWNRNEKVGILTMSDWQDYLNNFSMQLSKPLKIKTF